jgi:hypothetical protein
LPNHFEAWFDETGTPGANSLDACFFIDTNADGNSEWAICPEGMGNPSALSNIYYFSCDNLTDDCTGGDFAAVPDSNSVCGATQGVNPFNGGSDMDAVLYCDIDIQDFGVLTGQVSNICTYPGSLNSGGTDCIPFPVVVLPVELTSFEARLVDSDVVLTWETASETNNAGFAIEHSDNGGEFNEIAFVTGAGTSISARTYGYTINEIPAGLHRFRLKQVDFDGAFHYSAAVEVTSEVPGTHLLSEAYPNPFNPSTSFSLAVSREQEVAINVYDMLGRHVASLYRGTLEANVAKTFSVNASNWTSGSYTVVVEGNTFRDSRSLVLLK